MMRALLRKSRDESGVIALLTLAFMISAGMATIVLLWSIGVITGAFNALYAANQTAAYAAASATRTPESADNARQLPFDCRHYSGDQTVCDGGKAFNAAEAVMSATLNSDRPGTFGMEYGVNTFLTDQTYSRQGLVKSYEIGRPAGQARAQAARYGCSIPNGRDEGYTNIGGNEGHAELNCWRLTEFGVDFGVRFQNAIVSRAITNLNVVPGCGMDICDVEITVVAAAVQDQPSPYNEYEDYFLISGG